MTYLNKEQNERFVGTGERDSTGKDLQAFLEEYDPAKYLNPCNTVDTLVFTYKVENGKKQIHRLLLIKRGNHPSIGWWALPGGFVDYRENLDEAALRELQEETGIQDIEVEQLKTYGAYDRDPRARIITTAYVTLVPEGVLRAEAGDDAKDAGWFCIEDQLVSSECDNQMVTEVHCLKLTDASQSITTETFVNVTYKEGTIFKQKNYEVTKTKGLAADHGAIVLEGYHYVYERLRSCSEV